MFIVSHKCCLQAGNDSQCFLDEVLIHKFNLLKHKYSSDAHVTLSHQLPILFLFLSISNLPCCSLFLLPMGKAVFWHLSRLAKKAKGTQAA